MNPSGPSTSIAQMVARMLRPLDKCAEDALRRLGLELDADATPDEAPVEAPSRAVSGDEDRAGVAAVLDSPVAMPAGVANPAQPSPPLSREEAGAPLPTTGGREYPGGRESGGGNTPGLPLAAGRMPGASFPLPATAGRTADVSQAGARVMPAPGSPMAGAGAHELSALPPLVEALATGTSRGGAAVPRSSISPEALAQVQDTPAPTPREALAGNGVESCAAPSAARPADPPMPLPMQVPALGLPVRALTDLESWLSLSEAVPEDSASLGQPARIGAADDSAGVLDGVLAVSQAAAWSFSAGPDLMTAAAAPAPATGASPRPVVRPGAPGLAYVASAQVAVAAPPGLPVLPVPGPEEGRSRSGAGGAASLIAPLGDAPAVYDDAPVFTASAPLRPSLAPGLAPGASSRPQPPMGRPTDGQDVLPGSGEGHSASHGLPVRPRTPGFGQGLLPAGSIPGMESVGSQTGGETLAGAGGASSGAVPGEGAWSRETRGVAKRMERMLEPVFERAHALSTSGSDAPGEDASDSGEQSAPGMGAAPLNQVHNTFNVNVAMGAGSSGAADRLGLEDAFSEVLRMSARRHGLLP